ncbi:MAG: DNA polymerase III subunit delta', partial [Candidatus Kapabacteria bacterium]|nr:DNA polymerase III subunit delta' [Candidatus Kapabacteria bacterium]
MNEATFRSSSMTRIRMRRRYADYLCCMHWNDVIGQRALVSALQRSIAQGRTPQALLLLGDEGTGAMPLSLAFAATVNCLSPKRDDVYIAPCGTCQSCRQMATMQHPNVRIIVSLPAGKGDSEDDMKADLVQELRDLWRTLAEDPYTETRVEGATQIKIGQIRELKRMLSLSAPQQGRRVVIVHEAHEMTTEASNAFLKTLEEPHEHVTLILTSSQPERVLSTISSRCQTITLEPIEDSLLIDALVQRGRCTPDEASLIAPFANGSLTRAYRFLGEDMQNDRETILNLLRASLRGSGYRLGIAQLIDSVTDGRNKHRLTLMLSLLQLWIRDAMAVGRTTDARIANTDQREALEKFTAAFPRTDYDAVFGT